MGSGLRSDRLADLELEMWKAYYRRQGAASSGCWSRPTASRPASAGVRAVRAAVCAGPRRHRVRAGDGRVRPLPAGDRRAATGCWVCRPRSTSTRSRAGSCAGGWSGARSGWRRVTRRARRSRACMPRSTRSRRRSSREAGALRGQAAEVRDRGATDDPAGPAGPGRGVLAGGRSAAAPLLPQPQDRASAGS